MKLLIKYLALPVLLLAIHFNIIAQAINPIIHADVPDLSMIRVGNTYYMSSTTMHMSPGLPIMKSTDLINWKLINYAYQTLGSNDEINLNNGKNAYGKGSWASSLQYHNGTFYVTTFSATTGKTYIFTTKDIEKGNWKEISFAPSLHDHSLVFDDGKAYLIYGAGKLMITRLKDDLSGVDPDFKAQVLIENASKPAGSNINLQAEGSQLFKINGKYYLFNITWPRGGMRTVVIHRADKLMGPYEGKLGLQDQGVAQGGLISTPKGEWFSYLFQDHGSVGRIPYLVPVKWDDGWPILGVDGKVPATLNLPASKGVIANKLVESDEFTRRKGDSSLPLAWQWNHNPDNANWSLTQRPGFLRITSSRIDTVALTARNTLTQRTFGPTTSSGVTALDISNLKDGDRAGLLLLQQKYAWVGVKVVNGVKSIVMINGQNKVPVEAATVPLNQKMVYLKAICDFTDKTDKATFAYSLDGKAWTPIGTTLQMSYTLPHFMGYRFGLFTYATKTAGGYADFDYFRVSK